ncbi:MAG TPA: amidohydrolase family protein [Blastocatellia bacterium]|nr:amidohydrolase family protein [Blastocatellia bacterium]
MKNRIALLVPLWLMLVLIFPQPQAAQTTADPQLVAEIAKIKAIDNHAHPLRFVAEGDKPDDEYDALPLEGLEPFGMPPRVSPANPEYIGAWRALFGYKHDDMSEAHVKDLIAAKQRVMRERGDGYPAWVLDQLGIETMFANRVAMGRGLTVPRYRWVSFVDALMFPLNNEQAGRSNPDYRVCYAGEDKLLKRYLAESKVAALPATLDEYLKKVVTATLERQKRDSATAVKFEAAYLRSLDFDDATEREALRVYAKYVKGGEPPTVEYKALQDYLFRYIAREAGRLGMAVHIHSADAAGSFYKQSGSNPLLLESAFNDPVLRKTNFVIVHGGYPFTKQTASLMSKSNVYADFSAQTFLLYPRALSEVLRNWLEYYPAKVLFGTDAFAFTPEVGWEEGGWLAITTAREALALALTGMMNDGEITRDRALELARMVMRENALRLYNLKSK